jgi:serine/threonine-protein kinase RsbW
MRKRTTLPPRTVLPEKPRTCAGSFRGRLDQVRHARAFVAAFLGGCVATDDAMLLIGELCANAVMHTGSGKPGGIFTVRAKLADRRMRAEVEDQGSAWDGRLDGAESPHGLFLLRRVAADCGTRRGAEGWITWFTLATPAPATLR